MNCLDQCRRVVGESVRCTMKTETVCEQPESVLLCSPQIPHGLDCYRSRVSAWSVPLPRFRATNSVVEQTTNWFKLQAKCGLALIHVGWKEILHRQLTVQITDAKFHRKPLSKVVPEVKHVRRCETRTRRATWNTWRWLRNIGSLVSPKDEIYCLVNFFYSGPLWW